MNPYREYSFMHSACDFLLRTTIGEMVKMDVADPVTFDRPSLPVVRAAINKIGEATNTKFRTRVDANGSLFVIRIK